MTGRPAPTPTSLTRTLSRVPSRGKQFLASLPDDAVDVSSFNPKPQTVEFRVDTNPDADPFHLTIEAWDRLGRPERIAVTVVAFEDKP